MILDSRNEFCSATALNTGGAGTYTIGNQIDLGTARNLGGDQALYLVVAATTGIAAGSAGTVQFQLVSADDAALTTNPVVHTQSAALVTGTGTGTTTLAAGNKLFAVQVPDEGSTPYKRYLGVRQVTGVAAVTAGAVDAFLTTDVASWKAYDAPYQA
jgi:hypothetical protein